jgi:hypothetical protein
MAQLLREFLQNCEADIHEFVDADKSEFIRLVTVLADVTLVSAKIIRKIEQRSLPN